MRSPHRQPQKSPSCSEDSTAKNKSINNCKKLEGVFIKKKKKLLARNTAKPPRGDREGGPAEDTEGEGEGVAGNSLWFSSPPSRSHSALVEQLLLKTQLPDIRLQKSSPRSGVPACSVLMRS